MWEVQISQKTSGRVNKARFFFGKLQVERGASIAKIDGLASFRIGKAKDCMLGWIDLVRAM